MSDIDKIYNLLEKVYSELQETKAEVKDNSGRLSNVEGRLGKIEFTLEHDVKNNIKVLNEVITGNNDKLETHSEQFNSIATKLDYISVSVNAQDRRLTSVEVSRKAK